MKVGDLVKMKRGYSLSGLVVEISNTGSLKWIRILWSDYDEPTVERCEDVRVINESR